MISIIKNEFISWVRLINVKNLIVNIYKLNVTDRIVIPTFPFSGPKLKFALNY